MSWMKWNENESIEENEEKTKIFFHMWKCENVK